MNKQGSKQQSKISKNINIDEVDDEFTDNENNEIKYDNLGNEPVPKQYFSMIEDNSSNALTANQMMINMGSIDSRDEAEFNTATNTVNNKNNRKLKKATQDNNMPINDNSENMQVADMVKDLYDRRNIKADDSMILEERRAKSSLGESSATRLRSKLVGAQKLP